MEANPDGKICVLSGDSYTRGKIHSVWGYWTVPGDNEVASLSFLGQRMLPKCDKRIPLSYANPSLRRRQFLKAIIFYVCSLDEEIDRFFREIFKYLFLTCGRSGDFTEEIGDYVLILQRSLRRREMLCGSKSDSSKVNSTVVEWIKHGVGKYREYVAKGSQKNFCTFLAGVCNFFSCLIANGCLGTELSVVFDEVEALISSYPVQFLGYKEIRRFANQRFLAEMVRYSGFNETIFPSVPKPEFYDEIEILFPFF